MVVAGGFDVPAAAGGEDAGEEREDQEVTHGGLPSGET
jgi:hypothetical protein